MAGFETENKPAGKTVEQSRTVQVHILRNQYLNGYGQLFGGQLMMWIDEVAGIVSRRHCNGGVTTASVDKLDFSEPAYINDLVVMEGKVTYVGRTSMEIRVDSYVESGGVRKPINRAYVVMVAIDENRKPVQVPRLELVTQEEKDEWAMGEKRYALRAHRKKEGY